MKLNVIRSKEINAPAKKVFEVIENLEKWKAWSPWLIVEPDANVKTTEEGNFHEWQGKRIGEGNLRITEKEENSMVACDLTFLKPWKSKAKTKFVLTEKDNKTNVEWHMDSSLPFFLFWMKKMMIGMLSMDYDRGLNMLKEVVEEGKANSKLGFEGESDFNEINYVGIKRSTSTKDLPNVMAKDFETIFKFFEDKPELANGFMFSQYHKWNLAKGQTTYTSGFGVKEQPKNLPPGMVSGKLSNTKVYTIKHTGAYHHLGNAWSGIMSMQQAKEIKPKKGYPPFEVYVNDPQNTKPEDLITEIKMPLK